MLKKKCGRCERFSFSSVDRGAWNCPSCGEDLSTQLGHQAKSFTKLNHQLLRSEIATYQALGAYKRAAGV